MNIISIQEVGTGNGWKITFHNSAELLNLMVFWNITDNVEFFLNEFRLNTPQFIRSNTKIKLEQNEEIMNFTSWILIYSCFSAAFCFVLYFVQCFFSNDKTISLKGELDSNVKQLHEKKIFSIMELSLLEVMSHLNLIKQS